MAKGDRNEHIRMMMARGALDRATLAEAALAITDETKDSLAGYLIECAQDQARADACLHSRAGWASWVGFLSKS
jgi:hypothetical protein